VGEKTCGSKSPKKEKEVEEEESKKGSLRHPTEASREERAQVLRQGGLHGIGPRER